MAERLVPPLPEPASSAVCTRFGSQLDPVSMPPARLAHPHETYIVQVQKDRIYRVPPPENAYLAERYRADRGGGGKSGGSTCSPSVLRTVGVVVAAALLLGAVVVLSAVVLRPDAPSFSINKLSVHNASRQQHMDYDFFLTAINPNKLTALWYKDSGTAKLLHRGTTLAKGGVGEPAYGGEDATDFNPLLHSSPHNGRTPRVVEKALRGSKHALPIELSAEIPVQVHVGALGFGRKRLAVACSITAAGLIARKDVRILSQNCRSSFGN